jgi:hypothetical protein
VKGILVTTLSHTIASASPPGARETDLFGAAEWGANHAVATRNTSCTLGQAKKIIVGKNHTLVEGRAKYDQLSLPEAHTHSNAHILPVFALIFRLPIATAFHVAAFGTTEIGRDRPRSGSWTAR